jgi:hypothetical protein
MNGGTASLGGRGGGREGKEKYTAIEKQSVQSTLRYNENLEKNDPDRI